MIAEGERLFFGIELPFGQVFEGARTEVVVFFGFDRASRVNESPARFEAREGVF